MSDSAEVYAALSEPFDLTFTDVRGGVSLVYITGEQVVTRLNEVLGPGGWSFRVRLHDFNAEADEYWVLGELTAIIEGVTIVREQFGSQKSRRSRSTGAPLDIGFDLKGATTDAMKKCASLLGVGLYLSRKAPPAGQQRRPAPTNAPKPVTQNRPVLPVDDSAARTVARSEWDKAVVAAKKLGISPSTLADDASLEKIQTWTSMLQQKVQELQPSTSETSGK